MPLAFLSPFFKPFCVKSHAKSGASRLLSFFLNFLNFINLGVLKARYRRILKGYSRIDFLVFKDRFSSYSRIDFLVFKDRFSSIQGYIKGYIP